MILDGFLKVAAAQSQTGSNEVSASSVDLTLPEVARRIGNGEVLSAVWVITTAAAGDSASLTDTCDFEIISSTAAALNAGVVVLASRRVAAATLTAGAVVVLDVPSGTPAARYLGTRVSLGTGDTLSADAYFIPRAHVQDWLAYANNYVV